MCVVHYIAVHYYGGPELLQWCYISGIATSVWNHGTVSSVAVWSDRLMMLCGFLIDMYFMSTLPFNQAIFVLAGSFLAVGFYFVAKAMQARIKFFSDLFPSLNVDCDSCHCSDICACDPYGYQTRSCMILQIPVACFSHCLAHLLVTITHIYMLYFLSVKENY